MESLAHSTLQGADWYWECQQGNLDAQWLDLWDAPRDQFGHRLLDIDLWEWIRSWTQKGQEPFPFDNDIRNLVCKLQQLPKEAETLRSSLRPEIIWTIFPIHITSGESLGWVEKFENQQNRLAVCQLVKLSGLKSHLSEVDAIESFCERANQDCYDMRGCWNCGGLGHQWQDCVGELRRFSYGCGTRNMMKPQWPRCMLPENWRTCSPGERNRKHQLTPQH